jgi:hypothetical protein
VAVEEAKASPIQVPLEAYEDRGVYGPSERMHRVYQQKAGKGTYRFDSNTGTYYFSKKDAGTSVIIVFAEHGKLQRKTVTIGHLVSPSLLLIPQGNQRQ